MLKIWVAFAAVSVLQSCQSDAPRTPPRQQAVQPPRPAPEHAASIESGPDQAVPSSSGGPASAAGTESLWQSDDVLSVQMSTETWDFAGAQGQLIITPHYRLHTTVGRTAIVDPLPLFMERALKHYTTALSDLPMPRRPIETYLLGTRSQWEDKTRQMLPDQASTYLNLGRGGFTTRGVAILYDIGQRDTLSIAAHEGWHQYSQQMFRHSLPVWLEEGIATYMEGYLRFENPVKFRPWANFERYGALRQAARDNRLIALPDLLRKTPQGFLERSREDLLSYYAQVWALTMFLSEGENGKYASALRQLLQDAAAGRIAGKLASSPVANVSNPRRSAGFSGTGPAVVLVYFNSDLSQFQSEYEKFVEALTSSTAGRGRVARGLSPIEP